MTGHDEALSMKAIEVVRGLQRKAGAASEAQGISLEDVSVGTVLAAFDIAQRRFGGDRFAACEFLRNAADLLERQLIAGETMQ